MKAQGVAGVAEPWVSRPRKSIPLCRRPTRSDSEAGSRRFLSKPEHDSGAGEAVGTIYLGGGEAWIPGVELTEFSAQGEEGNRSLDVDSAAEFQCAGGVARRQCQWCGAAVEVSQTSADDGEGRDDRQRELDSQSWRKEDAGEILAEEALFERPLGRAQNRHVEVEGDQMQIDDAMAECPLIGDPSGCRDGREAPLERIIDDAGHPAGRRSVRAGHTADGDRDVVRLSVTQAAKTKNQREKKKSFEHGASVGLGTRLREQVAGLSVSDGVKREKTGTKKLEQAAGCWLLAAR